MIHAIPVYAIPAIIYGIAIIIFGFLAYWEQLKLNALKEITRQEEATYDIANRFGIYTYRITLRITPHRNWCKLGFHLYIRGCTREDHDNFMNNSSCEECVWCTKHRWRK